MTIEARALSFLTFDHDCAYAAALPATHHVSLKAAGPGRSGIAVFEERIIREEGMNGYIMTPVQQVSLTPMPHTT